jgi:hypothetical protein
MYIDTWTKSPTLAELTPITSSQPVDPAAKEFVDEISRKSDAWNRELWFTAQTLVPPDPKRSQKDTRRMVADMAQALFDREMFGCAQRRK